MLRAVKSPRDNPSPFDVACFIGVLRPASDCKRVEPERRVAPGSRSDGFDPSVQSLFAFLVASGSQRGRTTFSTI